MPYLPPRSAFDHIGILTNQRQEGEVWVEENRLWVTNPRQHPYNVEYLRFESDSTAPIEMRTKPHIAYRVDDLEAALKGHKIVKAPFDPSRVGFVHVAFIDYEGALIEFMQYRNPNEEGWF